ncbi:MAG: hypothetical protein ACXWL2_03780 [Candidatus Chromulinivorax sp.]
MKKIVWSIVLAPFFLVSQNTNEQNQLDNRENRPEENRLEKEGSRFEVEFYYPEPKRDIENRLDCCEKIGLLMDCFFQKYVNQAQAEMENKEKID